MGVKQLFVRCATFAATKSGVRTMLPQQWPSGEKAFPCVLVFNFDLGLLTHFESLDTSRVSADMASGILKQAAYAANQGVQVRGVQLDIDSPTRLLPKYGDILGRVRTALNHKDWSFSATALTSWLYSPKIASIAKQVDFLAPQFYERDVALNLNDPSTISDLHGLRHGLDQSANLGIPFYAGIASYGHAILYDEKGRFASIYHGLNPEDALRHPAFKFESSEPLDESGNIAQPDSYVGEDRLTLVATRNAASGKGIGYHLVYDLPTPAVISAQNKVLEENAPGNCLGMIIYRLPPDDDPLALSAGSVAAALRGQPTEPEISAKLSEQTLRTASIGDSTHVVNIELMNKGNAATGTSPGAVQVLIQLNEAGFESASLGGFDEAIPGSYHNGSFVQTGKSNANAVLFKRSQLLAGQTITAQILLRAGCRALSILTKEALSGQEIVSK